MIKVLVNGCNGRMGQLACRAIENDPGLKLVGKTGREDNLIQAIQQSYAQVVVDLTVAGAAYQNALKIIEANAHPVIGTSGLHSVEVAELQKRCAAKKLGGIIAANFSLGAILMMQFAEQAAKYFQHVEIIERHHENKHDAPSGTAIRTAERLSQVRHNAALPVAGKELIPGARGANLNSIPIHAIRLPGYLAAQEIVFGESGETFTISHHAINRECYMPGLLLACKKVTKLQELVYGLEHIL